MPVHGDSAHCLVCGWAYEGLHAGEHYERHMQEHNPFKAAGWLTQYDKRLLKTLNIIWGDDE